MSLGCNPGFLLYQTFRLTGAKKAQELRRGGFFGTREGSVFLKNFEASVFLGVFAHACMHTHARLRPAAAPPTPRRRAAGRRAAERRRARTRPQFFADSAEQFVTATNHNCSGGVANRSGS
jgi:hypothetical protein